MRVEHIGNCTLYLGDCLEILPHIGPVDTVITDPVWPNNSISEFAHIDPYKLFAAAWAHIDTKRAVIQLGCDSNPNILNPIKLPFFRVAWLEYVCPHYKGRLLYTSDIAYLYGEPPASIKGNHSIPGKIMSKSTAGKEANHPCPRKLTHVSWCVQRFSESDDLIIDPFMGSGTTGVACVELGRKFIGIEINEKYFDIACERIEIANRQGDLFRDINADYTLNKVVWP